MKAINQNILFAAKRWAAANKSDPFALATAIAHAKSGVSSMSNNEGKAAYYDAEEFAERRVTATGDEYTVQAYRNLIRP